MLEIMAQLKAHMRAVDSVGGQPVTRTGRAYAEKLDDPEIRRSILDHCREHGYEATIADNAIGSEQILTLQRLGVVAAPPPTSGPPPLRSPARRRPSTSSASLIPPPAPPPAPLADPTPMGRLGRQVREANTALWT